MATTNFYVDGIKSATFTPTSGTAIELACVGAISGETETQTKVLKCAGVQIGEKSKNLHMNLTFRGHMSVEAYRALFGMVADDVVTTKYAYGANSKNASGALKVIANEFYGLKEKTVDFGNVAITSGYAFNYENGAEEVAEVEVTMKAMADVNGDFFNEEIKDVAV